MKYMEVDIILCNIFTTTTNTSFKGFISIVAFIGVIMRLSAS